MPDAWSNKDERKYEHIKEGYEERGKSEAEAEEIAAISDDLLLPAGVQQKTGHPNTGLEARTTDELENRA